MRAVFCVKKLTNSIWSRATSIRQGIERDPRANERLKRACMIHSLSYQGLYTSKIARLLGYNCKSVRNYLALVAEAPRAVSRRRRSLEVIVLNLLHRSTMLTCCFRLCMVKFCRILLAYILNRCLKPWTTLMVRNGIFPNRYTWLCFAAFLS